MPSPSTSKRHVALLRGINVGGKNKLSMRALAGFFEEAGCGSVQTYIQSGNVIFSAPDALLEELPIRASKWIQQHHGCTVPVILRSAKDLDAVANTNPFLAEGADPDWLHVMFLAHEAEPGRVQALDPGRSVSDRFAVRGREVYLCCPQGMARCKLTNDWFDRCLATTSTCRNWRTVLKLAALAAA